MCSNILHFQTKAIEKGQWSLVAKSPEIALVCQNSNGSFLRWIFWQSNFPDWENTSCRSRSALFSGPIENQLLIIIWCQMSRIDGEVSGESEV